MALKASFTAPLALHCVAIAKSLLKCLGLLLSILPLLLLRVILVLVLLIEALILHVATRTRTRQQTRTARSGTRMTETDGLMTARSRRMIMGGEGGVEVPQPKKPVGRGVALLHRLRRSGLTRARGTQMTTTPILGRMAGIPRAGVHIHNPVADRRRIRTLLTTLRL